MKTNQKLIIETKRLILVPMTYQFVLKMLNNDIKAYDEFNIKPIDDWPSNDIKDILPMIKDQLSSQLVPDGFGVWLFIDKEENVIIGDGGFKGIPNNNGEIELGYGIIKSKRRQGYAYEAVTSLIKWSLSQDNVKIITANCLKSNIASINLIKKLRMIEVKQDDELIYYALNL